MNPKVITDPQNPEPVEIIAQSIVEIADAMKRINKTRLTRHALIVLIQDHTKLGKQTIDMVLNSLEALERIYLNKA